MLVAGHQTNALSPLSSGHVEMTELVCAAERCRNVALHRGVQTDRTGAVVGSDMSVRQGCRIVDGDVDGGWEAASGHRLMGFNDVGAEVTMTLRRETHDFRLVDIVGHGKSGCLRVITTGGSMELFARGFCSSKI